MGAAIRSSRSAYLTSGMAHAVRRRSRYEWRQGPLAYARHLARRTCDRLSPFYRRTRDRLSPPQARSHMTPSTLRCLPVTSSRTTRLQGLTTSVFPLRRSPRYQPARTHPLTATSLPRLRLLPQIRSQEHLFLHLTPTTR